MKIGFIGAGQMANALAKGFVKAGKLLREDISMFDRSEIAVVAAREAGFDVPETTADIIRHVDIVFLSVKPNCIDSVFSSLQNGWEKGKPLVSICAGVSIDHLESRIGRNGSTPVIRIMPNTPSLVNEAASAITANPATSQQCLEYVKDLMSSIGIVYEVAETQMDAVTAVSGSGPAYIYTLIEALADGGVLKGLPRKMALELAAQTVYGSAKMVLDTKLHPAQLRDMVTSPGGTTIEAVASLEKNGFRHAIIEAVKAAHDKSVEMGSINRQ